MDKNTLNDLGVAAAIVGAGILAWLMVKPTPEVMITPDLVVPPVYTPGPTGAVGEGPSEGQPQPVYPPDVVPPVTVHPPPLSFVPWPVPVDEVVVPSKKPQVNKPVVKKPRVKKPVKVVIRKKRKKYVSHRVTYPKPKRPDFYPKKYWQK